MLAFVTFLRRQEESDYEMKEVSIPEVASSEYFQKPDGQMVSYCVVKLLFYHDSGCL